MSGSRTRWIAWTDRDMDKIKAQNKDVYTGLTKQYESQKTVVDQAVDKLSDHFPEGDKISHATFDSLRKQFKDVERMIEVDLKKVVDDIMTIPVHNRENYYTKYQEDRPVLMAKVQDLPRQGHLEVGECSDLHSQRVHD